MHRLKNIVYRFIDAPLHPYLKSQKKKTFTSLYFMLATIKKHCLLMSAQDAETAKVPSRNV